ncbi:MAG: single-stranded DNA-binding protein [Firmicutes bacterium]|nr:single-stranded DNA-binding protein [Bacillota bacterium]MCL2771619.1 single-stranded DNA-binding protein [Bacillota bacterium]
MNKVILIGNLTRDPETSTTGSGIAYTRFSIAVQRRFSNADGVKEVDFFDCVAWRSLADLCQKFLAKGRKVCVEGSIQIRNYEDKDGIKRRAVDIQAENVTFLSPRGEGGDQAEPSYKQDAPSELEPVEDDDLPF